MRSRTSSGNFPPSSEDQEDQGTEKHSPFPVAERWLPKPEVLEKTAGMHRFVWNLAEGSSGGPSEDEESESRIPSGPKAVPGIYQVRLTVDGQPQDQSLKVIMDPRSPATPRYLRNNCNWASRYFAKSWKRGAHWPKCARFRNSWPQFSRSRERKAQPLSRRWRKLNPASRRFLRIRNTRPRPPGCRMLMRVWHQLCELSKAEIAPCLRKRSRFTRRQARR